MAAAEDIAPQHAAGRQALDGGADGAGHRLVDTMGRIDRFRRKYGQTAKPAPSA